MNHTAEVAEPVGAIVAILEDVFFGDGSIEAEEVADVFGAREQIRGVPGLGRLSKRGLRAIGTGTDPETGRAARPGAEVAGSRTSRSPASS
jgi:hypothetical protein